MGKSLDYYLQYNMKDNSVTIVQVTTFAGALVTSLTPIVSLLFMIVSIVSGIILIYKFFKNKK